MKSLIYLSHNTSVLQDALGEMVDSFNLKNMQHEITGYLLERQGDFIQYLEGPCDSVDRLLRNIRQDTRHRILFVLERHLKKRRFPSWNMHLLNDSTQVEEMLFSALHERIKIAKKWHDSTLRIILHAYYSKNVWKAIDDISLVFILNDINPPKDTFR